MKHHVSESSYSKAATSNCLNNHDLVKAYISLFNKIMGVVEFLDWHIDIARFFDVMGNSESVAIR